MRQWSGPGRSESIGVCNGPTMRRTVPVRKGAGEGEGPARATSVASHPAWRQRP